MYIDIRNNTNDTVNKYLNLMTAFEYKLYINTETRISGNSKTCLGHIFINHTKEVYKYPRALKSDITDHFSTILQIILAGKRKHMLLGKNSSLKTFFKLGKMFNPK